jgi:hypothetical protein
LCPFYRVLKGIAGISVQLGGSILGLIINLVRISFKQEIVGSNLARA